jgi:hypothetical protein
VISAPGIDSNQGFLGPLSVGGLENVPSCVVPPVVNWLALDELACAGIFGHIRVRVCNQVWNYLNVPGRG